jgi:tetratricopeptide (TPR) repeat protein
VLLAKGGFLIAIEKYQQAFYALGLARTRTDALSAGQNHPLEAARLTAKRHREEGIAWLQLGSYARAKREFEFALTAAVPDAAEARLIRVLMGESVSAMDPDRWRDAAPYADGTDADDLTEYQLHLGRSEAARRKRDWPEAEAELYAALEPNYGDARRRANIEYRLARLCLTREAFDERVHHGQHDSAERAIRHAATALLRFQKMGNPVGEVRARCLLARALTASGRCGDAAPQSELALREIETLSKNGLAAEMVAPLIARAKLARGQALLKQGDFKNAAPLLEAASSLFAGLGDAWSQYDAMYLLGIAQHKLGRNDEALASLHASYSHFIKCGDKSYASGVVASIARAESKNGMRLASAEYRLKATRMRWSARQARNGLRQLVTAHELSE